jgi:hypothetical protein
MIDMLLENTERKAYPSNAHAGAIVFWNGSNLEYIEVGKPIRFDILKADATRKWKIIEPPPKRSYKDVLLEKFPNAKIGPYEVPINCLETIFGKIHAKCNVNCKECWNSEYKEDEAKEDKL